MFSCLRFPRRPERDERGREGPQGLFSYFSAGKNHKLGRVRNRDPEAA
jgi:hypothetical protein